MFQANMFDVQPGVHVTTSRPVFSDSLFHDGSFESLVGKELRHCKQFRRVRIYRNLNKPEFFSIVSMEGKLKGKVCGYAKSVLLEDFTFIVSEASRLRVLREQRRNVHAYCDGIITDASQSLQSVDSCRYITYNPYISSSFYDPMSHIYIDIGKYQGIIQGSGAYLLEK